MVRSVQLVSALRLRYSHLGGELSRYSSAMVQMRDVYIELLSSHGQERQRHHDS